MFVCIWQVELRSYYNDFAKIWHRVLLDEFPALAAIQIAPIIIKKLTASCTLHIPNMGSVKYSEDIEHMLL